MDMTPREMRARLTGSIDLAPGIRHFEFEIPGMERFGFVPGQFLSLTSEIAGDPITRAYSIASPPEGNRFALCLNEVEEGRYSPHLFSLKPGDEVDCKGPYGGFVLRRPLSDSILVATGTGIAPFRSMLRDRLPHEKERRFTLIFGGRYEHSLLYRTEWEAMAAERSNFEFRPALTRPEPAWTGRTGRIQAHVLEALGDRRDVDVYICGLKEMVNDLRAKLKETGLDRKRIVYERYD
jgi:CDP-4-dehydro-6-deoxyglucose reductase